ncbi:MAG: LacI family DNA-binding transcriptional regulator [Alphaproteobacteria bacterium]|nr:LacI family DNA-binding transcriptional regulator [Alphaproteobacteria bacterium]
MTYRRRRRTLKDVAQIANVSEMTVSRVLRGTGVVAAGTRRHVMGVVEELGYVQNHLAGSLATSRSNQVAVIIPSLINNVFPQVLAGITGELEKAGYNAVIGISDYDLEKEESLVTSMISWRPAGFITTNLVHSKRTRNILANASVPVVEMMDISGTPIDICVGLDHRKVGRVMVDYLLRKGYRRFGYLGWSNNDFAAATRYAAIRDRLAEEGLGLVAPDLYDRPPDHRDGKEGLATLLSDHPDLDAVMFSNDTAASGGVIHCLENNIAMPEEIALAGFSGLQLGQIMPRKLTTIRTKRFDTGRLAARSVLNQLVGQEVEKKVDLGFELIEGETA